MVFVDLATAWDWLVPAMGKPQRAGLRPTEIMTAIKACGVRKRERQEVYQDIRLMERAALALQAS